MDFDKDPFDGLFLRIECPKCDEEVVVGVSDSIKKYGFVCPYCQDITNAGDMWELVLESRMTGSSED